MEKRRLVLLAAACVLQLAVLAGVCSSALRTRRDALRAGRIITLECAAYDPYHPFKGRYVRLSFPAGTVEADSLDVATGAAFAEDEAGSAGNVLYCCMECGADGLWRVTGLRRDAFAQPVPGEGGAVCVRARARYWPGELQGQVLLRFPFDEYYLQENYARYVDTLRAEEFNGLRPRLSLYVDRKGRCVQQGLSVESDGQRIPIETYCRRALASGL